MNPQSRYIMVWQKCSTNDIIWASLVLAPYMPSIFTMARFQGPAPLGVGTSTATLLAAKQASPATGPNAAVDGRQ